MVKSLKVEKTKIKKNQLQKQKQSQNVIVNINKPVSTRKRKPAQPKTQTPSKIGFQTPIYKPPVVSYQQPTPTAENILLKSLLKHIEGNKQPVNQLEKKPVMSEEEKAYKVIQETKLKPTLPNTFNDYQVMGSNTLSLVSEMKQEQQPQTTSQLSRSLPSFNSFEKKPVMSEEEKAYKVIQETKPKPTLPNTFNDYQVMGSNTMSLLSEMKEDKRPQSTLNLSKLSPPRFFEDVKAIPISYTPLVPPPEVAEPKVSLVQRIKLQEVKPIEKTKQPWAELERGSFGTLGISRKDLEASKNLLKQYRKAEPLILPAFTEQQLTPDEEIDLGIVPEQSNITITPPEEPVVEEPLPQIMQEQPPEEKLITEPIPTKENTEMMGVKALTMGEEKPYTKSFLYSSPTPQFKPQDLTMSKEMGDKMREARIKALDKPKPLTIKQEAEAPPTIPESISPETQVSPDIEPEIQKLKKLKNYDLQNILGKLGGSISYIKQSPSGKNATVYKNKTMLVEELSTLKKSNPSKFTELLNTIK